MPTKLYTWPRAKDATKPTNTPRRPSRQDLGWRIHGSRTSALGAQPTRHAALSLPEPRKALRSPVAKSTASRVYSELHERFLAFGRRDLDEVKLVA